MTREEAIEALTSKDVSIMLEALEMAIEALEQLTSYEQTINKLTKAISEQEPFDIETYCKEHFCVMVDKDVWEKAEKVLKQEPILDKIRAEITDCLKALDEIEKSGFNIFLPNEISGRRLTYQQCLEFIDKYRGEVDCRECKAEYECYYCKKYAESEEA